MDKWTCPIRDTGVVCYWYVMESTLAGMNGVYIKPCMYTEATMAIMWHHSPVDVIVYQ